MSFSYASFVGKYTPSAGVRSSEGALIATNTVNAPNDGIPAQPVHRARGGASYTVGGGSVVKSS